MKRYSDNNGGIWYMIKRILRHFFGLQRIVILVIISFVCFLLFINNSKNSNNSSFQTNIRSGNILQKDIIPISTSNHNKIQIEPEHFIQEDIIDKTLCTSKIYESRSFQTQTIPENKVTYFPIILEYDSYKNFQLCFAKHNGHEHEFRFFLEQVSEGDCDLYISATEEYPSQMSSQWKSDHEGDDIIIVYSDDQKLRESDLHTLFIAVTGKSSMNECKLNIEIRTKNK